MGRLGGVLGSRRSAIRLDRGSAGLGGSSTPGCVHGFSHEVLFGILPRLCGADACIFPNYGGRFGFTQDACKAICDACWSTSRLAPTTKPCLPSPGGGMTLERIGEMREVFGNDLLLLIGGSLLGHDRDDVANGARYFMKCAGRGDDDQREQKGKEKATANKCITCSPTKVGETGKTNGIQNHLGVWRP